MRNTRPALRQFSMNNVQNGGHLLLQFDDGTWLSCDAIGNAAGLWADHIARLFHTDNTTYKTSWQPPRHYIAKGHYMKIQDGEGITTTPNFQHLIYPVPEPGGLGVHATLDWATDSSAIKFGPSVDWVDPSITNPSDISLHLDDHNDDDGGDSHQKMADEFTRAIQTYWPSLPTTSSTSDQG